MLKHRYYLALSRTAISGMTQDVVVTRKGHTTIPAELRRKYKIREGSRMLVEDAGNGILLN